MPEPLAGARPLLEVADVIRSHGEALLQKYGGQLSVTQKKALRDLARCRTAALGGHVQRCLDCGEGWIAYNSCRNRHCPKCQVCVLMVLHTWGQSLHHHPHAHCVVTGGGLSCDAQGEIDATPRWVSCRPGFFLPVRVLSRVFRGTMLAGVRALGAAGKLVLPALGPLYAKDWVVYAKPPIGGPEQVLKYLARYTHRVAICNSRLVAMTPSPLGGEGTVTFRYRDYADSRREKLLTLSAEEFLRRFVVHVLPKGFMKIRHYGLLASRQRESCLRQARKL